ncbi:NUDIX hydrolase [Litoribrevibacter euphylliae]|uniref:NUDIX hydrolase n=1 Tax=Litoribrevibacter euphylliae TaxID=1834034 RepID=A0ABV7HAF5_9GAMM
MKKSSAWGLIEKDGKFLFIKRSKNTSRSGQWCPPGGGVKELETPEAACLREVKEEVGLAVQTKSLIRKDESFYYFHCFMLNESDEIVLKLNECEAYEWVSIPDVLKLGPIMELKRMLRIFRDMGFIIEEPENER